MCILLFIQSRLFPARCVPGQAHHAKMDLSFGHQFSSAVPLNISRCFRQKDFQQISREYPAILHKSCEWHITINTFKADLAKKTKPKNNFVHGFLLFYVRLLCSINFCFGPVEMRQFKNNCSGLKIDWDLLRVQLLTECVVCHYILLFYTNFCRLGLQT